MNRTYQHAVVAAVAYFLLLTWIMFSGTIHVEVEAPRRGLADWSIPAYALPAQLLVKNVSGLSNPFVARFFEQVTLKGFVKGAQGTWAAILQGPVGLPKILAPGAAHEGVTLLEADGRTCKIRCGTVVREMAMGAKNVTGQFAR